MRRLGVTLLGVLAVVLLSFLPVVSDGSDSSDDPDETARITSYDAAFTVDRDGTLRAKETITVDFPLYKHGIFRFFDVADPSQPGVRLVPQDIDVTRDGEVDGLDVSRQDGGRYVVARIGNPDVTIDGSHTYVIHYRVPHAVEARAGRALFYWNVVPGGWTMPIARSTTTVRLPADVLGTPRCAVGVGTTSGCATAVDGRTLTVRTGALPARTPVTVQAGLDQAPPGQTVLPWGVRLDPVLGRSVPVAVVVLVLALLAAAVGWWLARGVHEDEPAYPLTYAPPDGIGPAQGAYVLTERVTDAMFTATMLELGERGLVGLGPTEDGWKISNTEERTIESAEELDEVTRATGGALRLAAGASLTVGAEHAGAGKRVQRARKAMDPSVRTWALTAGLLESRSRVYGVAAAVLLAGVVALLLFVVNPLRMSLVGLPFGLFVVFAAPVLQRGSTTVRTAKGRQLWSQVGGFRRVLATPSSEQRFDFGGRKELYTTYVPWAVAFGCADVWAAKYRLEVGEDPPAPAYFVGGGYGPGWGSSGGAAGFSASFDHSVHSAISAYQATQASSSSGSGGGGGFSGGGFSGGGGGGGGGGGSW